MTVGQQLVDTPRGARDGRDARGGQQVDHRAVVIGVVVRQGDAAEAAARVDLCGDGVDVLDDRRAGIDDPAGSRPSTHVFVPDSVSGPGFAARTSATSWRAIRSTATS